MPETSSWVFPFGVSPAIPKLSLQRENTKGRDLIKLPASASMHSSVYQIDFLVPRKNLTGMWEGKFFLLKKKWGEKKGKKNEGKVI